MAGKHPLVEQMDALRAEVDILKDKLVQVVAAVLDSEDEDRYDHPHAKYPQCLCTNCGALLGVYNTDTEELQMRVKDQFVYSKGAPGSHLRIICRRCLTENVLRGE